MSTVAVNTTPTEKMAIMAIVGLSVLVSVAVSIFVTRRRGRGPEHTPRVKLHISLYCYF